ncbi:MAG: cobalamin biosynthesis protein [Desulfuromonadales bacterium]|nr:cobalamin biosynthesis protein [Desulfuromonadales bacterium]
MTLAICAITAGGAALARRLGTLLPEAEVWLPEKLRSDDQCRYSAAGMAKLLPQLFARGHSLICIMATGIVVRSLAPLLRSKASDPAVVVLDEAGHFAISLLSGHLGGANALTRQVATLLGATPVITTATDVNNLCAWDEAARFANLAVEPLERIRTLNNLLLQGEKIALVDHHRLIAAHFATTTGVTMAANFSAAGQTGAAGRVFVTERLIPELAAQEDLLLLRPRRLVLGIGCNRHTSKEEIDQAVENVLKKVWLARLAVGRIATIVEKGDETGLLAFAEELRLPLITYSREELNRVRCPSPPSAHALAAVGAHGVCEPAALLAAEGGPLLIPKQKCGQVTVAVARLLAPTPCEDDQT